MAARGHDDGEGNGDDGRTAAHERNSLCGWGRGSLEKIRHGALLDNRWNHRGGQPCGAAIATRELTALRDQPPPASHMSLLSAVVAAALQVPASGQQPAPQL